MQMNYQQRLAALAAAASTYSTRTAPQRTVAPGAPRTLANLGMLEVMEQGACLGSQRKKAIQATPSVATFAVAPLFKDFANQWVEKHSHNWRPSHTKSLLSTLNGHLIPYFGNKAVCGIEKSHVIQFLEGLCTVQGRGKSVGLSAKRINDILALLSQILDAAAVQYPFKSPMAEIKRLPKKRSDIDPFSLVDVHRIIAAVRADFKDYFTTRFFTGMKTGEIHGLKWIYVDFEQRVIQIRETLVLGEDDEASADGSQRDILMSQPVFDALKSQFAVTGRASDYVFCNLTGQPLDNKNFSDRVWYPLLSHLNLDKRRPYQTRHTAATLWLAAGESPQWIARQLGYISVEALARVYSEYAPNLSKQDGSSMERLLAIQFQQGVLLQRSETDKYVGHYAPAQKVPKPRGLAARRSVFAHGN